MLDEAASGNISDEVTSIIVDVSSKRDDEDSDAEEVVKTVVEVPSKKDDAAKCAEKGISSQRSR